MNANIFEKANQIIKSCDTAYLGVIDESGYPSVSTVSVVKPENMFEVYFTTNIGSNKEKRLSMCNRASVCFQKGNDNITLVGDGSILTDQETKSRYWVDWFKVHYPGGETDPNYIVIKFTAKRATLWVDRAIAEFTMDELLTIQSRCGLLCNGCTYRESHGLVATQKARRCSHMQPGCKGCIAIEGKPFWGECPVAACCNGKGYTHCGECADMPCDILREFSCGDGDECDKPKGARIEVCKAWKK